MLSGMHSGWVRNMKKQSSYINLPLKDFGLTTPSTASLGTYIFNRAAEQYETACKLIADPLFVYAYLNWRRIDSDSFPFDDQFVRQFVWYGLAESKLRSGERTAAAQIYENAIVQYEMAIKERGNNLFWFHGDFVRVERGRFEVFYKQTLENDAIWVVLGEAYKAKGDRGKANAAFRCALEITPGEL